MPCVVQISIIFPEDAPDQGPGKVLLRVKDMAGPFKFRPLAETIVQVREYGEDEEVRR